MRHSVYGRKLGRDINARKTLLNNLATSVFINGQVETTLAKAKFAKSHVEKMITAAKDDRLGKNRVIASNLGSKAFARLIAEIAPGFKSRTGGYVRITKLMPRRGDNAPMARLELLEWEKVELKKPAVKTGKRTMAKSQGKPSPAKTAKPKEKPKAKEKAKQKTVKK